MKEAVTFLSVLTILFGTAAIFCSFMLFLAYRKLALAELILPMQIFSMAVMAVIVTQRTVFEEDKLNLVRF